MDKESYEQGYNEGYDVGKDEGYSAGSDDGFDIGYQQGWEEAARAAEVAIEKFRISFNQNTPRGIKI